MTLTNLHSVAEFIQNHCEVLQYSHSLLTQNTISNFYTCSLEGWKYFYIQITEVATVTGSLDLVISLRSTDTTLENGSPISILIPFNSSLTESKLENHLDVFFRLIDNYLYYLKTNNLIFSNDVAHVDDAWLEYKLDHPEKAIEYVEVSGMLMEVNCNG